MTADPPRFYGTDMADGFETLVEITVDRDGIEHMDAVFLEADPPSGHRRAS